MIPSQCSSPQRYRTGSAQVLSPKAVARAVAAPTPVLPLQAMRKRPPPRCLRLQHPWRSPPFGYEPFFREPLPPRPPPSPALFPLPGFVLVSSNKTTGGQQLRAAATPALVRLPLLATSVRLHGGALNGRPANDRGGCIRAGGCDRHHQRGASPVPRLNTATFFLSRFSPCPVPEKIAACCAQSVDGVLANAVYSHTKVKQWTSDVCASMLATFQPRSLHTLCYLVHR
jgi:hypothetical protein